MDLLAVEGIQKHFRGVAAVSEFAETIEAGEITGLIGSNGAGKTTAFNVISGFLPADAGVIRWRGERIEGMPAHRRAQLGIVRTFQHTRVLGELTVLDNLRVGSHRRKLKRSDRMAHVEVLERLHLTDIGDVMAGELPYGLAKLVNLGIALAAAPALLMLDEPAAGLNSYETESLRAILEDLKRDGMTIWVIEHNMRFVMGMCDRITAMSEGRVIASGTPDEIKRNKAVQDSYLGETV
jgi:ABC-type branched-subunit amino acid transport system ATPase component